MSETDRPTPDDVRSAAEFVAAMGKLKEWTGCTVRELEKKASEAGGRLPRSTLTAALGRNTLPRQELVEAFVRACGGDDDEVRRWGAIRRTLAVHGTAQPEPQAAQPKKRRRALAVVVALVLLAAGTTGVALIDRDPHEIPPEGAPVMAKAAEGEDTGLLRREHDYRVHCHMATDGEQWLLTSIETTNMVGFVNAGLLPKTATPACTQTGEPVGITAGEVWQHPKPDAWSQHTGTIRPGTGRTEDVRWYLFRRGVSYHGSDGYVALMDLAAPEPVIGFISCTDTTVGCDPPNPR